MRLSKRHEGWVYASGGLLFLSGLGWLLAHYFLAIAGEFGEAHHPSEIWWLRVHGAAAMAFLMVFGSLFQGHIARAWHLRKNLPSGLVVFGAVQLLLLSGYGLYYVADEQWQPWISTLHWIIGLLVIAVLFLHVKLGKSSYSKSA
jgi:hypothetical protein